PTRWRVFASGAIQRSTDAGATWTPISLATPPTPIAAGIAPGQSICWFVGRAGLVLLTTDGISFRRVSFPEAVDLASIDATDARRATVVTADGRVFVTDDGGATWKR